MLAVEEEGRCGVTRERVRIRKEFRDVVDVASLDMLGEGDDLRDDVLGIIDGTSVSVPTDALAAIMEKARAASWEARGGGAATEVFAEIVALVGKVKVRE